MTDLDIIGAVVLLAISAASLVISILQFLQKGFVFNSTYMYADEEERKKLDKKPLYLQSGIGFACAFLVFLLNGLEMIFKTGALPYIALGLVAVGFLIVILVGKKK